MKAKVLAVSVVFLFLMIGLSGCDELEELNKPNYIIVKVEMDVRVSINNAESDYSDLPKILINAEIIKDGGERVSDIMTTNEYGYGRPKLKGTFNLYKEQDIVCIANVVLESASNYPEYTFNSAVYTITWEMAKSGTDWGESVTYFPDLKIYPTKNS